MLALTVPWGTALQGKLRHLLCPGICTSCCCFLLVLYVLSSASRPVLLLVLLLAQDLGECASLGPDPAVLLYCCVVYCLQQPRGLPLAVAGAAVCWQHCSACMDGFSAHLHKTQRTAGQQAACWFVLVGRVVSPRTACGSAVIIHGSSTRPW